MGRPRLPSNVLDARGSFKKHPDRARERAAEPVADSEIGDPPETLGPEEAACWTEIVGLAHAGTLSSSDRLVVEHGAQLLAMLRREQWKVHPALLIRWEGFLAKMGMTPADRSKVSVRKPPADADPIDEFSAAG